MKLLLDENLAPRLAQLLTLAGHEAGHVRDLGLQRATDEEIFDRAAADGAVLVTEDTDFGAILAQRESTVPSLILLRSADPLTPDQQAALIVAEIPLAEGELFEGAVLVLGRGRARVRSLPIGDISEGSG